MKEHQKILVVPTWNYYFNEKIVVIEVMVVEIINELDALVCALHKWRHYLFKEFL